MRCPLLALCLLVGTPALAQTTVEKWRTYELTFTTSTSAANPFDTYLLNILVKAFFFAIGHHPMSAYIFARTSASCSGDTRPFGFASRLRQSMLFT